MSCHNCGVLDRWQKDIVRKYKPIEMDSPLYWILEEHTLCTNCGGFYEQHYHPCECEKEK